MFHIPHSSAVVSTIRRQVTCASDKESLNILRNSGGEFSAALCHHNIYEDLYISNSIRNQL